MIKNGIANQTKNRRAHFRWHTFLGQRNFSSIALEFSLNEDPQDTRSSLFAHSCICYCVKNSCWARTIVSSHHSYSVAVKCLHDFLVVASQNQINEKGKAYSLLSSTPSSRWRSHGSHHFSKYVFWNFLHKLSFASPNAQTDRLRSYVASGIHDGNFLVATASNRMDFIFERRIAARRLQIIWNKLSRNYTTTNWPESHRSQDMQGSSSQLNEEIIRHTNALQPKPRRRVLRPPPQSTPIVRGKFQWIQVPLPLNWD